LILEKRPEDLANFELVEAYGDHCIKEFYKDFVMSILFEFTKDDLEYFRKFALDVLTELLIKKCEIEELIVQMIINKLGDGSRKVQLHTIMLLCKILK
jgi:hypothetical protein